jgi:probable F420-dependent oxidoreductase
VRFTFIDAMVDPSYLVPLAVAAEGAGYDGFAVPDSIAFAEESDSRYPYTPTGEREFLRGRPFIEPFTLIGALSAVTQRIRFATFVLKLPMRHPVIAAKQAASAAVLSGNRVDLGVGLSPWPEDYQLAGVPWERRGKRFDEQIDIVKGLTGGGFFGYAGEFFAVPSIELCPVPTEPIPILIGGHSEPALRRAARIGDGWMHAGAGGGDDLDALLGRLGELRREYGRESEPFSVHVISLDAYSVDGIKRMEAAGITDAIVGFRDSYRPGPDTETLEQKLTALRRYSDSIITKLR